MQEHGLRLCAVPCKHMARSRRALAVLAGATAAVAFLSNNNHTFLAPLPWRDSPRRGAAVAASPPARTAAEDQEVTDKLDEVLRRKLSAQKDQVSEDKRPEDDVVLSPWTQKAVEKATGEKKAKALKKKATSTKKPKSRKIVKSLDEVLKSASDDSDRPSYLPARRDVYKEVGITQAEVDAYWSRRDDSAQSGVDKFLFLAYPAGFAAFIAICFSVYDSIVNPQTEYLASMTGTG